MKLAKFLSYAGVSLIVSEIFYVIRSIIILMITFERYGDSHIGIIGGADAPTAIFLTGELIRQGYLIPVLDIAVLALGIVCIVISIIIRKKSK